MCLKVDKAASLTLFAILVFFSFDGDRSPITIDLSEMVARNWRDTLSKRGASRNDIEMLENSFSEAGKKVAHSPVANRSDDAESMEFS